MAYSLLLRQITRGTQYHYDGVVLELEGSAGAYTLAAIQLGGPALHGGCGGNAKLEQIPMHEPTRVEGTSQLRRRTLCRTGKNAPTRPRPRSG
jgi:hypothetical protein